jgi:indolepyruvate ferredoxin oxidoreductase beta subunit
MTTAENRKPKTENPRANLRIFLTGVGGQGTLLASRLLGEAALAAGYNPMVSETHGMAQRGGIVVSTVVRGICKAP